MNSKTSGKVDQPSRGISLTWKITMCLSSVIALLGLGIVGIVYQLTSSALQDQFDQRASAIAANLSDAAAAHLVRKDVLELYGLVTNYALLDGVEYAFITDGQGAVIAHSLGTFPPELRQTVSTKGQGHAQRRTLRFRGKIVYETSFPILGGRAGAAHVKMQRDFIEGEIRRDLLPMIGIISTMFVGGIVLCSLLVWVMIRPIRDLNHIADCMSKGDLDTPVDIRVKSHEIGDLARSLERMRTSLKAAMSRLSISGNSVYACYQGSERFIPEAVEKTTSYPKGIPQHVNVICDNDLPIASSVSKKHLSGEMIDEVVRDLKLTGQPQVKAEAATDYQLRGDLKAASQPTQARTHPVDVRQRLDLEPRRAGMYTRPPKRNLSTGLGIGILAMAALAGAGIVLYSQENESLAALVVNFKNLAGIGISDLVGLHRQNLEPARPELTTEGFKETLLYESPDPQVPTTKDKEIPRTPMKTIAQDRPLSAPDDVAPKAQQLGLKIDKAIDNRKIRGVEVFVEEGTVYLTGRVATENQKLAAAQAARSVPGVKEVLDQIIVNSVASQQQTGSVLAIEKVAVQDETVTGEIRNQWNNTVRDVQLSIRYEFLWKNERHPGKDNPSATFYHPVSGDIAPGESLPFKFTPSPELPKRSDGRFAPPSVSIGGFTKIIPQDK